MSEWCSAGPLSWTCNGPHEWCSTNDDATATTINARYRPERRASLNRSLPPRKNITQSTQNINGRATRPALTSSRARSWVGNLDGIGSEPIGRMTLEPVPRRPSR